MKNHKSKKIIFSQHALDQLKDRGALKEEVEKAIMEGEKISARQNRVAFRKNFFFNSRWKGKSYTTKQVMPIVVEEENKFIVVTVYVFYFGGNIHDN